jgi:potassium/hydrogen antiporter
MMFNMVFFIVVISMLVQGTTVGVMAKWLGVQERYLSNRKLPFKSRHTHSEFIEFYIPAGSPVIGKSILQMKLPKDVLVVLIHRSGEEFIPRGNTQIQRGDRLVCLSAKKSIPHVEAIFGSEHFFERKMG